MLVILALGFTGPMMAAPQPDLQLAKATGEKAKAKKKRKKRKGKRKRRAKKGPITVPVDIGIGPAVHLLTGPLQDDQTLHYGVKISLQAIVGKKLIRQNLHRVPRKYRAMAKQREEIRLRPTALILLPDTIYISPRQERTAMYGANWRLLGLGTAIGDGLRLGVGARLNLSYAYLDSTVRSLGTTHFLRPGVSADAELEIPVSASFLLSFGWSSYLYPPQEVGGPIFALGEADASIWHIGQGFAKLHFRFPYTTNL